MNRKKGKTLIILTILLALVLYFTSSSSKEGLQEKEEEAIKHEVSFLVNYDYEDPQEAVISIFPRKSSLPLMEEVVIPGSVRLEPGDYFFTLSDDIHSYEHQYFTVEEDMEIEITLFLLPDITGWSPLTEEDDNIF